MNGKKKIVSKGTSAFIKTSGNTNSPPLPIYNNATVHALLQLATHFLHVIMIKEALLDRSYYLFNKAYHLALEPKCPC